MTRYVNISSNVVDVVRLHAPSDMSGWAATDEVVFAGWTDNGDGTFSAPTKTITPDDVKAEAMRRILAIVPEWRQRNLTARAAELAKKGSSLWTTEEQAEWAAGEVIWAQVKVIRAASNNLEVQTPIPQDYASNDVHWS